MAYFFELEPVKQGLITLMFWKVGRIISPIHAEKPALSPGNHDMPAVATIPVNPTLGQRLSALDQGQRIRLALGVALFVAIAVIGMVMGRQAEWRVLYSNLADKDGGAVIAQLTTMNVPYKYTEGGGAIMVPAERVHDVRLKLASQGLPKALSAGSR